MTMNVNTPYARVHLEDGVLSGVENSHLRVHLPFRERVFVQEGNAWKGQVTARSESVQFHEEIVFSDFVSGTGRSHHNVRGYRYRALMDLPGLERRVTTYSASYDDCWIFLDFVNTGSSDLVVRQHYSVPTAGIQLARKRQAERRPIAPGQPLERQVLKDYRIAYVVNHPAQDLFIYANYQDETLRAYIDEDRNFTIETKVPAGGVATPLVIYHQVATSGFSDTLFLVEAGNWIGGFAAVAFQRSCGGSLAELDLHPYRRILGPASAIYLTYSFAEGLLHYQRFLLGLPRLQTIVVIGRISSTDYALLRHVLTQREYLPPGIDPESGQLVSRSKIFVISQDQEYLAEFAAGMRSEIEVRILEQVAGGLPTYVPRTEPVRLSTGLDGLADYRQTLRSWFSQSVSMREIMFVVPPDPPVCALAAPLIKYLGADVVFADSDRSSGQDTLVGLSGAEGGPALVVVLAADSDAVRPRDVCLNRWPGAMQIVISYGSHHGLARRLGCILANSKLVDFYLCAVEGGHNTEFRLAMESVLAEIGSSTLGEIAKRLESGGSLSATELEVAKFKLPEDLQTLLQAEMLRISQQTLGYYLSPANHPRLVPHVILSNWAGKDFETLFVASNYAAGVLAPLLLLRAYPSDPKDPDSVDQEQTPKVLMVGLSDGSSQVQVSGNVDLKEAFPIETRRAIAALSPRYMTLIPAETGVEYELAEFEPEELGGMIITSDDLPWDLQRYLGLRYAVGRLAGNTPALTSRVAAQAMLASDYYRGNNVSVVTCGDTRHDLPDAEREIEAVSAAVMELERALPIQLRLVEASGYACTRRWFVDACNSGVDFIHFSGHARSSVFFPMDSYLEFADGQLTALEIMNELSLTRSPVVLLNGCETAGGVSSVYTAFLRAHAGEVVGSLWPVFDREAALLGRVFTQLVMSGLTIGQALQLAKAHVLQSFGSSSENEPSTPLAYVLIGDPLRIPFVAHWRGVAIARTALKR